MVQFEAVEFDYLLQKKLRLSLSLTKKFSFLYHNDKKFVSEFFNIFNGTSKVSNGSIIVDQITINELSLNKRNAFFYNYVACNFDLSFFNQKWTIKKVIEIICNLYDKKMDDNWINNYLKRVELFDKLNIKLCDLKDIDLFLVSFLLAIIKKPKIVLLDINDQLLQNNYKQINSLINFVYSLTFDINILCFTTFKNLPISNNLYDLTSSQFYLPNKQLTVFSNQNFSIPNIKSFKKSLSILTFFGKCLILKNKWWLIFISSIAIALMFVSFMFCLKQNTKLSLAITYTSAILAIIFCHCFHYLFFFKSNKFLINFNTHGFNHILIMLSTIITTLIVCSVPLILSTTIYLIVYYSCDWSVNNNLFISFYPFIIFIIVILISTFVSSIKLRINIYT